MPDAFEICVIKTDDEGNRQAVVFEDEPARLAYKGVPFLFRYLRTSRRRDAPPGFQFCLVDDDLREWAKKQFERST